MKYPSKAPALAALLLALIPAFVSAAQADLFATVPTGDATYSQLAQLESAGLLPKGDHAKILTRFEVAQRIQRAQEKYDEIVVAQVDDIPPPPADSDAIQPSTAPAAVPPPAASAVAAPIVAALAPAVAPAPEKAASDSASPTMSKEELVQAEKNLHSLAEAYQFELKVVKDEVKQTQDRAAAVDASQLEILKKLNGITEYPNVAFHGVGRAFGISRQSYGSGVYYPFPGYRAGEGYLDLRPEGVISKQVRWNAILRLQTSFEPDFSTDSMVFRRITMELNPEWFSATIGDFDESYTPFTIWNRNNLDLNYMPEMVARLDRQSKYESFFDKEPDWPFRGLRIGTELGWTDSDLLEKFKASTFVHMISNGFDVDSKNASFFGPTTFTDWIWAGRAGLQSKKWYVSNLSVQLKLDAQGVILDEPLYTNAVTAVYKPADPTTWAHQYLIGSWTPEFRLGFGGEFYFGISSDLAFASYQDDKLNDTRVISDYAATGGPYFELGASRITFNFLDVGPYFYSPLAQTRQDGLMSVNNSSFNNSNNPDIFQPALRSRFFLTNVPRPSEYFSFYDRTQDNTFPYGLATPNRQGVGIDLDVKAFEKQAFKIKGSAYFVREISGNLVANFTHDGYTAVDSPAPVTVAGGGYAPLNPAPVTMVLIRNFTYVNVGPSLNIGPLIGWDRDLEIGANIRMEQTNSAIGTLTSTNLLGGIRVGVLPSWDLSAAYGVDNASGTEVGYLGTLYARYPYLFDNTDLGNYQLIQVNGSVRTLKLSSAFKVNRNSRFFVDYDLTHGDLIPNFPARGGTDNQFMELTYEIEF